MILSKFFASFYNSLKKNRDILLYLFGIISVVLTFFTYFIYKSTINASAINFTILLVIFDLLSILGFIILLATKILALKKGNVVRSLQSEIIMMFSIITIIPTILISIFSIYFFIFGIQSWFNDKVTSMLDLSVKVGESYVEEHNLHLKNTAISFAKELSSRYNELKNNPKLLQRVLNAYADVRELDEAIIFEGRTKSVIAQSRFSYSLTFNTYPEEQILKADTKQVVLLPTKRDRIRFLIKLDHFDDTYLIVGRMIDEKIIEYVDKSNGVAKEFHNLQLKIESLQIKFIFIFILVSVLLLIISINIGIVFAGKILKPIKLLVNAIRSVKQGDFATRIKTTSDNNEIALLSKGFNEMVTAIDQYRKDLVVVQKSLAWSDVARRVAHEIKNPLTPMQLAAERLRSKFSSQIYYDKDNYDRYINIITRHIDDISKIIFNFINFVQMPKPNYINCNFLQLINELVESRKALHEDVEYILSSNISAIDLKFDQNQINQVFVNIFQNAEESLKDIENKQISISIIKEASQLIITVNDNGIGLPQTMLNRPIEPYFTTKSTGTGLGLSIVDRIINDHDGVVELSNNSSGGASICLKFNLNKIKTLKNT